LLQVRAIVCGPLAAASAAALDGGVNSSTNCLHRSATADAAATAAAPGLHAVDDIEKHSLFIQLDVLCHFEDESVGWKEMAR
jgi:hypothetical protein